MKLFRRSKHREPPPAPAEASGEPDHLGELVRAAAAGTLPLDEACRRARELGIAGAFAPDVLTRASETAFQYTTIDPMAAWQLSRIVQSAATGLLGVGGLRSGAKASADREPAMALLSADTDLITVAHARLMQAGDIRVFTTAIHAADEAVALTSELGLPAERGVVLQRRGAMILDCYTADRTVANYAAEQERWVSRALDTGDPELVWAVSVPWDPADADSRPALKWPEPLTALGMAAEDLREAASLVGPSRRGPVLKALAQTLYWRFRLGGSEDSVAFVEVAEQALEALDDSALEARAYLMNLLNDVRAGAGSDGSSTRAGKATDTDIASLVDRIESEWDRLAEHPSTAWDAVNQAVSAIGESDPVRALRILERHRRLESLWESETRRKEHVESELKLVSRIGLPPQWSRAWDSTAAFEGIAQEVLAGVSPVLTLEHEVAAAGLTLLMMASARFDREAVGLSAYSRLAELLPAEHELHAEAYARVAAELLRGEGINQERSGDHTAAVHYFMAAASEFLAIGEAEALTNTLRYAADLVGGGSAEDLVHVSVWCASHALDVELLSPRSAADALRRLIRLVVAHQTRHGTSVEELLLLFQAAKGRRFAASLVHGTTGWAPGPKSSWLLNEEVELQARLPPDRPLMNPVEDEAALDEEDVVVAFSNEWETSPADTLEGQVVNVRRAVERSIIASITPPPSDAAAPVTLAQVREALDVHTALVVLYEGQWVSGNTATFSVLVTRDADWISVGRSGFPYPAVPIGLAADGRRISVPPTGLTVAELRRAVQEEPAPRTIGPDGAARLAGLWSDDLRVVREHLDELRAQGIDHLLVLPHAAGHFVPFHLAGEADHPLTETLVVTNLTNLAQLFRAPLPPTTPVTPSSSPRTGGAVFALSYRDEPRLPTLDSSESEGRAIGKLLSVDPVLDAAATPSAFCRALESSRWVHLRAHGRHDVDAAMFQTVFLSAEPGHSGQLRAYEVLPLELRGLELVTLGACQSALGRIDESDNVRGLSAALMLAGAGAVIGTLWEVESEVSTTFFTTLYSCLVRDNADVVDAFAVAQRTARADYPEYRDWGAFFLTGGSAGQRNP